MIGWDLTFTSTFGAEEIYVKQFSKYLPVKQENNKAFYRRKNLREPENQKLEKMAKFTLVLGT